MKNFLEIDLRINPPEMREIMLALLDQMGYDSFAETDYGLKAYVEEAQFDRQALESLYIFRQPGVEIDYQVDRLENKNWNEEWETHYAPITVDDRLHIRAIFHASRPEFPLEILITPKMSFGTGHHQTTRLMARLMLAMDWQGQKTLDMGTGTGILAILAEKLGAGAVDAIDNFEWAVINTAENADLNDCHRIKAEAGDATLLPGRKYEVVLANINRNVLLEDMKSYNQTLVPGGQLLLSGFLAHDFDLINTRAESLGLSLQDRLEENNWQACRYQKS